MMIFYFYLSCFSFFISYSVIPFHLVHVFWVLSLFFFNVLSQTFINCSRRTCVCVCVCVLVTQSRPTLCDPMDYSPPGSSVRGYWSGLPFPSPGKLLGPGIKPRFPTYKVKSEVTQLCLTLCNPLDCNLPGSPAHGIIQAWILEWVAILFSRGSSWPRDWTQVSCIAGRLFTIWATKESIYINK